MTKKWLLALFVAYAVGFVGVVTVEMLVGDDAGAHTAAGHSHGSGDDGHTHGNLPLGPEVPSSKTRSDKRAEATTGDQPTAPAVDGTTTADETPAADNASSRMAEVEADLTAAESAGDTARAAKARAKLERMRRQLERKRGKGRGNGPR